MDSHAPSTADRRRHSVFRRVGWLAVAAMVLVSIAGPGAAGVAAVGVAPGSATLAAAAPADPACGTVPLDVEIILDNSGSMGTNYSGNPLQSRLAWAKTAAKQLISDLNTNGGIGATEHRVGITTFSGTTASSDATAWTSTAAELNTKIDAISSGGNTPLKVGMSTGASDLNANARNLIGGAVPRIIILLSDGRPNLDQGPNGLPATSTNGMRPTQSEINSYLGFADTAFSIAIGQGGNTTSAVDLGLMQLLQNPAGHYYNVVDASLLPTLFTNIFHEIACPDVTIAKANDASGSVKPGDKVHYTVTVGVANGPADVTISDDLPGNFGSATNFKLDGADFIPTGTDPVVWAMTNLATGDHALTYDVLVGANTAAGDYTNTASITAPSCVASCEASSNVTVAIPAPAISLVKTAAPPEYDHVGQTITYTYVITNTGNVSIGPAQFTITDDHIGSPLGTAFNCGAAATTLAPNETVNCTATYTITQADLNGGQVMNYAVAHGAGLDSLEAQARVTADWNAVLHLDKTAEESSYNKLGDTVTYSYLLTNNGNVTLSGPFTVTDDHIGSPLGTAFNCGDASTLAPLATTTCTASYTITQADLDAGSVTNVATGYASFNKEQVDSNQDTATVPKSDLKVAKGVNLTGDGVFVHTLTTTSGTTVHYRIVVTNDGNATLTGVALSDSLSNLTVLGCTIPATLAPAASFTCNYTATAQVGTRTNTATADSDQTPSVQDSATVFVPEPPIPPLTPTPAPTPAPTPTAAPTPTPTGSVEAVTAKPQITPPPTDTFGSTGQPSGDSWRLALLAIAGLLAILLLLTPVATVRNRRR